MFSGPRSCYRTSLFAVLSLSLVLTATGAVSTLLRAIAAHDVRPRGALLQGAVGAAEPGVTLAPNLLHGVPGGFVSGSEKRGGGGEGWW